MNRKIYSLAVGVGVILSTGVATAESDTYYYLQAQHSGKCAQQHGGIQDENAVVSQWECINQANVKLEKIKLGSGYFMLRFPHSQKCLAAKEDKIVNDNPVVQQTCNLQGPRNQTWREVATNDAPYVKIESTLGNCLHQKGGIKDSGGVITLWECVDQPNLRWQFIQAPSAQAAGTGGYPAATYNNGKLLIPAVEVAGTYYKVDMEQLNPLNLTFKVTNAVKNP